MCLKCGFPNCRFTSGDFQKECRRNEVHIAAEKLYYQTKRGLGECSFPELTDRFYDHCMNCFSFNYGTYTIDVVIPMEIVVHR